MKPESVQELIAWLRKQAAERSSSAAHRREEADIFRDMTAKELRESKAGAERMFGRKLPLVKTDVASNRDSVRMQEHIAAKLEAEANQLFYWAEELEEASNGKG